MPAIKTAELSRDFPSIANRVVKGEKIIVSYPEQEDLIIITAREYNELLEFQKILKERAEAVSLFKRMRAKVVETGDFMTDEEINTEIKASRAGA